MYTYASLERGAVISMGTKNSTSGTVFLPRRIEDASWRTPNSVTSVPYDARDKRTVVWSHTASVCVCVCDLAKTFSARASVFVIRVGLVVII